MGNLSDEYRFVIGGIDPRTIPMFRLAQYMGDVARLLGERNHVHFQRIEPGSVTLVQSVEAESVSEVRERINKINAGELPRDAKDAIKALKRRLTQDNATAALKDFRENIVLDFANNTNQSKSRIVNPFNQEDILYGTLIRIGGRKEDTIPVHLKDRKVLHICQTTRDIAQRLATHLYGNSLRVKGDARWQRDENNAWKMLRFKITDFDVLDNLSIMETIEKLREIKRHEKSEIGDPISIEDILWLRGSDEDE